MEKTFDTRFYLRYKKRMPQALSTSAYRALLNDIGAIYTRSLGEARRILNRLRAKAYWEIGERIVTVEQKNRLRAAYGEQLLKSLSADLTKQHGNGFSETNLKYMRQFYLTHPIGQPVDQLDWSKQILLLSVEDDTIRKEYEKKAVKEDWPKSKLAAELRKDPRLHTDKEPPAAAPKKVRLTDTRGIPGVYRIVVPQGMQIKRERPMLDLGFNIHKTGLRGLAGRRHNDLVEADGVGVKKASGKTRNDLYTYAAFAGKVVDGDTVWVQAGLGFGVFARRKLRLRGIDAPPLSTKAGRTAGGFLQRTLDSVEFIVIKTHGSGKFGRYLADIYYLPGEPDPATVARKGVFLNQELLDQGLAKLYLGEG